MFRAWAEEEADNLRKEVRALKEENAKLKAALRTVAERQRETCAYHMIQEQDYSAQACRRAPLVTEGDE